MHKDNIMTEEKAREVFKKAETEKLSLEERVIVLEAIMIVLVRKIEKAEDPYGCRKD